MNGGGRRLPRSALGCHWLTAYDTVLPRSLGAVEGGIGLRDEGFAVARARRKRRDAEAGGHVQAALAVRALDGQVLDRGTHALGQQLPAVQVGLREDHRELLTPVAGRLVDVA